MGLGMVPSERALVSSSSSSFIVHIGLHIGIFSFVFTRFRDIADFVLQHTTFPHPTSTFPIFSWVT